MERADTREYGGNTRIRKRKDPREKPREGKSPAQEARRRRKARKYEYCPQLRILTDLDLSPSGIPATAPPPATTNDERPATATSAAPQPALKQQRHDHTPGRSPNHTRKSLSHSPSNTLLHCVTGFFDCTFPTFLLPKETDRSAVCQHLHKRYFPAGGTRLHLPERCSTSSLNTTVRTNDRRI